MSKFKRILRRSSSIRFTLVDGTVVVVVKGDEHFERFSELIRRGRHDDIDVSELINTEYADIVEEFAGTDEGKGRFILENHVLWFIDGEGVKQPVNEDMFLVIKKLRDAGSDPAPLFKFYERLMANPEPKARKELFRFLLNNDIPIDQDGFVVGYRAVRTDFTAFHPSPDGTHMPCGPGEIVKMPRSECDQNPDNACSAGLHVGSWDYVKQYAGWQNSDARVTINRFDPADVVSVPTDHAHKSGQDDFNKPIFQKIRTCRYECLAEYTKTKPLPNGSCNTEEM